MYETPTSSSKLRTLSRDNSDDFFDDTEIGEIFLFIEMTFTDVKDIAEEHDYKVKKIEEHKAKIIDKKNDYNPIKTISAFSAINSISHSSGGFGGFSHSSGGFGGFGGGSFGGGGGSF